MSFTLVTLILKVSDTAAPALSVAITLTAIVPTSEFVGVPEKVCVEVLKESQEGREFGLQETCAARPPEFHPREDGGFYFFVYDIVRHASRDVISSIKVKIAFCFARQLERSQV